jgi:hypothetical protein
MRQLLAITLPISLALGLASAAHATVVFSTNFENGVPPQISAPGCQTESVQACAGLGAPGNQFGGNLLRYDDLGILETSLTLTDLPPHTHVSLGFLLALIDSWDGTELFEVVVDGQLVFSHWFQLATGDASSYVAPTGGLLSSGIDLGWNGGPWHHHDRALDLALEPTFRDIPHTASTLTVVWQLSATVGGAAANWQGGMDESWGIDNLSVSVSEAAVAVPEAAAAGLVLRGNAPNPFNPLTRIAFEVPSGGAVLSLGVYDVAGRRVRTLVDGFRDGGPATVAWDGRDDHGSAVSSGTYLCRLAGLGVVQTRRMVLLQ